MHNHTESMNGVGRQFDYKIPVNHSYDVVTPGEKILLWHNGQKLERRPSGWSTPISPFPFRRLAVTKLDSTEGIYYLYHQINGTIFAEDRYDIATDVWYSTNITLT